MEKTELSICVGSSCHLKNSRDVIEKVKEEITKRGLEDKIILKAAFCLGNCAMDGVTVKVNDDIISGVKPDTVSEFFDQYIK